MNTILVLILLQYICLFSLNQYFFLIAFSKTSSVNIFKIKTVFQKLCIIKTLIP